MVDSNDRERVSLARAELHRIAADDNLARAPVLVWANKQDVRGAMSPSELSEALNLSSFRDRTWQIFGCSALTGKGYVLPTYADSRPASTGWPRRCRAAHSEHGPYVRGRGRGRCAAGSRKSGRPCRDVSSAARCVHLLWLRWPKWRF